MEMLMKKRDGKVINVIYEVVREERFHPDIGNYVAFGIIARDAEDGGEIKRISDVSTSKETVSTLVDSYNRGELSHIHLFDVIEDFL